MRARSTQRDGFTLLEVVVSSGILFSVMLIMLNLATTSIFGVREGEERLAAEGCGVSVLESYRSRAFSSYSLGQAMELEPCVENHTTYRVVLDVEAVPGHSSTALRRLVATLSWDSKRGPQKTTVAMYVTPLLK